jgi:hypothetical protein
MEAKDSRLTFLQYLNTIMLTIIGIFTTVIFFMLTNVKEKQEETAKELLRIKTIQDINTGNIQGIDGRVKTLELNYLDYIKTWVDQNYLRKPQR